MADLPTVRNLQYLHKHSPDDEFRDFILFNADYLWDHARNENGVIGCYWLDYFKPQFSEAGSHGSGLDALVAAFAITN